MVLQALRVQHHGVNLRQDEARVPRKSSVQQPQVQYDPLTREGGGRDGDGSTTARKVRTDCESQAHPTLARRGRGSAGGPPSRGSGASRKYRQCDLCSHPSNWGDFVATKLDGGPSRRREEYYYDHRSGRGRLGQGGSWRRGSSRQGKLGQGGSWRRGGSSHRLRSTTTAPAVA